MTRQKAYERTRQAIQDLEAEAEGLDLGGHPDLSYAILAAVKLLEDGLWRCEFPDPPRAA